MKIRPALDEVKTIAAAGGWCYRHLCKAAHARQAEHRRGGYRRAAVQGAGEKDHGSALAFSGRCTGFSAGVPQGHLP